ncbi:hypothetical protein TNCV_4374931 [Trichonephila clavipes]|uniref:Uncharacterized protein n=1 Tax=Trichonephila clavipes TaxID=2585209 RepID=A0A8X7BDR9_TRICX|nr:hypothetical protein TNCV_4374931 [Trichonephila clavipes]
MDWPTRRPKVSHTWLIGDKSGDQAGQGSVVTVQKQTCDTFAIEGILKSHTLSSLLNFLRAFGDGPVAGVSGGQGIESWLACLEFETSATKDSPCRAAMHPDGRGYELVSSVRALVPQKFSVEEELMHVKHVDVKSHHVGVMWKFGSGVISAQVSSSSLNRGSKLRSRSSVATVLT